MACSGHGSILDQPGTDTKVFFPITKCSAKESMTSKLKYNSAVRLALKLILLTIPNSKNETKMHQI